MLNLQLNDAEEKVLSETLTTSLNRLRDEIHHTDSRDYRQLLQERKLVLEKIRSKLH